MKRGFLVTVGAAAIVVAGLAGCGRDEAREPDVTAPAAAPAGTTLAFRTPPGAVSIPVGESKTLGTVEVNRFERIRIVATERAGSAGPVVIQFTITDGDEWVADLDTLTMEPRSSITRVYEVPGTKLTVNADATGGSGSSSVDVLVYGFAG